MSVRQCMLMLQMLKARGMMSRKELAQELETTERNILTYRQILLDAGYQIESKTGKYGGYYLNQNSFFPVLSLDTKEAHALKEARDYIKSRPDFFLQNEYIKAMDKVLSANNMKEESSGIYLKGNEVISTEEKKMMERCESAKKDSLCVTIEYRSLNASNFRTLMIQPYEILYYHQAYYCLAYSMEHEAYRIFKFSQERMRNVTITQKRFWRDSYFDIKEHVGSLGLMKGDLYEVELIVKEEQARILSERKLGLNPQMEWLDEHTLHIKTTMEGKKAILRILLSMGKYCTIIKPQELKEEIKNELEEMMKQFY